jgi:hypothetical protein
MKGSGHTWDVMEGNGRRMLWRAVDVGCYGGQWT